MTRRPLCMLCLILMLSMCATDWAGIPLIRGNPLPENAASWIEEHPQATLCGEVIQTTENEFSQSVYLSNAYLIYQSQKLSIENVKVFLKQREEVPAGTVILVSGKLKRVEEKRNPGEFDSQQHKKQCQETRPPDSQPGFHKKLIQPGSDHTDVQSGNGKNMHNASHLIAKLHFFVQTGFIPKHDCLKNTCFFSSNFPKDSCQVLPKLTYSLPVCRIIF